MEDDLVIGPTETNIFKVSNDPTISISTDGGSVALYWDKNELKIKCENATLEEGAQKFFEHLRDHFGEWIISELRNSIDTCQYCGK